MAGTPTNRIDHNVTLTDGTNTVDVLSKEGVKSIHVVPGLNDNFTVNFDVAGVVLTAGYMLIDLSDTTNWPHTNTGHINLNFLSVSIAYTTAFRGTIQIGFLSDVDATNGDLNILKTYHAENAATAAVSEVWPIEFSHFEGQTDAWYGATTADSTIFQTDENLVGPAGGAAAHPSGDGDLVMLITRTAGEVAIGVTLGYNTIA